MMKEHVASAQDVPLDKPEQFLLELSEIPNFSERIACFMFQTEYEDVINGIDSKVCLFCLWFEAIHFSNLAEIF